MVDSGKLKSIALYAFAAFAARLADTRWLQIAAPHKTNNRVGKTGSQGLFVASQQKSSC